MSNHVVLDGVTLDFPIFDVTARSLRHRLVLNKISALVGKDANVGGSVQRDAKGIVVVRALQDIKLDFRDGDRVGLVGHNGAGKTTLLRVISGIYEPTVGEVFTEGRVMPLFNIMEGMAADGTGIEMVRVRGTLLGLTEEEIQDRIPEVADFCELGEYISMPVRAYSTGMLMRLAFAITTSVTSEILVMDEFIGTGDAAFVERADARLREFVDKASILVVASHSTEILRKWCNKGVLMEHGRVLEFGPIDDVIRRYEKSTRR